MKIAIGILTNRGFQPKTFQCLLELVEANKSKYELDIILAENGYTIAENRNYLAVQALNKKCAYILMIDDDMTFEPSLIDDLISNKKDIIGVAYHPRTDMQGKLKFLDETHYIKLEQSTDPKYKKTFECHATGTGIILINCEVFRKTPRPWFAFETYETGCNKLGEDWYFCKEAKEAGYKIFTDPRIKVGHLGEVIV